MHQDLEEILFSAEEIAAGVKRLGAALAAEYRGSDPLFIGVLKGAVVFLSDLIRAVEIPLHYDFIAVSSYGKATKSSGQVQFLKDVGQSIEGRDVVLVEDIVDTGLTLKYLLENLRTRGPRTLKVCTLLDKPERRQVEIKPDYNGFVVPDRFLVGYGLDFADRYRNLPYIGVLKPEIYRVSSNHGKIRTKY